jgi:CheY-like chemotaxis protein
MARMLIVDDNDDGREAICKYLEALGHQVICVPNGREALAHVLAHIPDVVLLDLIMPELDGPSFLEVVRSYLRLQSLPVVVFTALADSPMVARAQALKVNSILVKGKATSEDIRKALEEAIARCPANRHLLASRVT